MSDFSPKDYWQALVLYGLNQATYKIALGKTLLNLSLAGANRVSWEQLSQEFLKQYTTRLSVAEPMPQQSIPSRRTKMEQIIASVNQGMPQDEAISEVGQNAFGDVIRRFHNLAGVESFQEKFYTFEFGKYIDLTDDLHKITEQARIELDEELDARWGLLEGAFSMGVEDYTLANDVRGIYLEHGYKRKNLTNNIPFLKGYQGNICFYCSEPIQPTDIHVDHVFPRQVMQHDEVWNLVLAHGMCNESKSDKLVGEHYVAKLIARNENIMGSNHPWKRRIIEALGNANDPTKRASTLRYHYENVKKTGAKYWGGSGAYNPATDPFYKRLITVINNGVV